MDGPLVIVPESPFTCQNLTSAFVIALPCSTITEVVEKAIQQAYISFDLRLAEYIEIGGWENHSSVYRISTFEQLPLVVRETYREKFFG